MSQIPNFAAVVKRVMPAVVSVVVVKKADRTSDDEDTSLSLLDESLRRFFERQGEEGVPVLPRLRRVTQGSGFIIDPAGYVVTDDHVIAGGSRITVVFQDGSKHPARLRGHDAVTDLALLKIEASQPLPYVNWGDSDAAQVGDWVLAVGNPFGLGGTASLGIISARGRDIRSTPYDDFLQIDASLNLGSSGGPAFNVNAQVIGVNTAIYTPSGGSVGIGFAIPANLARPVIDKLKEHGKLDRGWLGVQIQEVTPQIAATLGLPRASGALVSDVTKGGPAANAGIKQGDVILSFDRRDISKARELPLVVAETPIGQTGKVKAWRNGRVMSLAATIGPMPEKTRASPKENGGEPRPESMTVLGLKLTALGDEWRKRLDLPKDVSGVLVTGVAEESPFVDLDLLPGDVIHSINQQPVTAPQQVAELLRKAHSAEKNALLLVNRQGVNHYIVLATKDRGEE
jgi:serine protease Do